MKHEFGTKISFRLDGNWHGEGIIKQVFSHVYEVELTVPCKEFDAGCMILVEHKEVDAAIVS